MNKKTITCAFRASLPVMAGYIVLGTGFGILMESRGFAWYWAALMSLIIYAGSMQYVAVDLLGAGANLITFALMTLAVNARHLFYGLTMLTKYKSAGREKPYLIFALTDETFSIVCAADLPEGVEERKYDLLVSILNQIYWIFGSILGALLGTALSFNSAGVEFSMTALFTVTVIGQWEKSKNHLPAIIGFAVSVICLLVFGPGDFLIPSMLLITVILLAERKFGKGEKENE
ncbi:MAG: AzlC family ABC transporter permease [Clostridiales bacterium]|nr:AzlC family ABC transporter permease [Clostridiales bacterium]